MRKRVHTLVLGAFVAALGVALSYGTLKYSPLHKLRSPVVSTECKSIAPLGGCSLLHCRSVSAFGPGVVSGCTYRCNATYADLRSYYHKELVSRGWHMVMEKHLRDWGRDLGGREAIYKKGSLRADLQYAGLRANYTWTYGFDVSWPDF